MLPLAFPTALPPSPQPVRGESPPGDHLMPTILFAHNEPSKVTAGDCRGRNRVLISWLHPVATHASLEQYRYMSLWSFLPPGLAFPAIPHLLLQVFSPLLLLVEEYPPACCLKQASPRKRSRLPTWVPSLLQHPEMVWMLNAPFFPSFLSLFLPFLISML